MEIRPERTADEAAVARIHEAAFPHQPEQVVALVNDLRSSTDELDRVSLVAVDDDEEPLGHPLFTPSLLDALDRPVSVHVLSPIGVLPHVQRRGVGSALVGEGIRILDERGVPAVFLEGIPATTAASDSRKPGRSASGSRRSASRISPSRCGSSERTSPG